MTLPDLGMLRRVLSAFATLCLRSRVSWSGMTIVGDKSFRRPGPGLWEKLLVLTLLKMLKIVEAANICQSSPAFHRPWYGDYPEQQTWSAPGAAGLGPVAFPGRALSVLDSCHLWQARFSLLVRTILTTAQHCLSDVRCFQRW